MQQCQRLHHGLTVTVLNKTSLPLQLSCESAWGSFISPVASALHSPARTHCAWVPLQARVHIFCCGVVKLFVKHSYQ